MDVIYLDAAPPRVPTFPSQRQNQTSTFQIKIFQKQRKGKMIKGRNVEMKLMNVDLDFHFPSLWITQSYFLFRTNPHLNSVFLRSCNGIQVILVVHSSILTTENYIVVEEFCKLNKITTAHKISCANFQSILKWIEQQYCIALKKRKKKTLVHIFVSFNIFCWQIVSLKEEFRREQTF